MARSIACDVCGKPTENDYSVKDVTLPNEVDPAKSVKASITVMVEGAGAVGFSADLCKECAIYAAERLAAVLRGL